MNMLVKSEVVIKDNTKISARVSNVRWEGTKMGGNLILWWVCTYGNSHIFFFLSDYTEPGLTFGMDVVVTSDLVIMSGSSSPPVQL